MGRLEMSDKDKKKPRTMSATDNEWLQLRLKAKRNGKELSKYVLKELKIKDIALTESEIEELKPVKKPDSNKG